MQKIKDLLRNNKQSFSLERVICRLLAAWCTFNAYGLARDSYFANLAFAQNTSWGLLLLCLGLLFIMYSCIHVVINQYETDTWFLMGGASSCVLQWLLLYDNASNKLFFAISVIVIYSMFAVYFVQKNDLLWEKWNPGKRTVWSVAIICGTVCGCIIAAITCFRHLTFYAPNFDFGLFVNMFHNMKETGLPLVSSERDVILSHFVVHLSPIYYLLLPFYILFPSPLTLQIGQAVVLASGVIPVVLLCKHFKLSGKLTILMIIIYAFYPAISTGCFYDIHENCFLTPLLLWMFYFFERRKYPAMYLFAVLTLLVKEDAAVYVAFFGLYIIFARKINRHGMVLMIGSLAYFTLAYAVLKTSSAYYADLFVNSTANPSIDGPMIGRFNNLIFDKSDGLAGIVKTVLLNPGYILTQLFKTDANDWGKILYFIQMLLPIGLIPFFTNKASRWLLICPILMNLLTDYTYQTNIEFQYHFGITAFLIYATISNLPEIKASYRRNMISIAVVACCCLYITSVTPALKDNLETWDNNKERYIQMETILDTIPKDASVCCSSYLVSHLADRSEIYDMDYHGNAGDVDYVVFDARYAIDADQLNAFLDQGYVIKEDHKGMLLILENSRN